MDSTVEILSGPTSKELSKELLLRHNIFIKDLSEKAKRDERQFVRIAIRDEKDNARLVAALRDAWNGSV